MVTNCQSVEADDVDLLEKLAPAINHLEDVENEEDDNLLHVASECGSYRCAEFLLAQNVFDMAAMNSEGLSYLDVAFENGCELDVIQVLLRYDTEFRMIETSFGWNAKPFEVSDAIITALEFNQYNFQRDHANILDAALQNIFYTEDVYGHYEQSQQLLERVTYLFFNTNSESFLDKF